ncbi:Cell shape-determining protein MreC [bacterium HR40]|nr:Cell shape-determining protein MreC [bacterium HR40]
MASHAAFPSAPSRMQRLRQLSQRHLRQLRRTLAHLAPRLWLLCAVALLVVSKADLRFVNWLSATASDLYVPAAGLLYQPVDWLRRLGEEAAELLVLREENARLRARIGELERLRDEALRLEVENRVLRRMLAMPSPPATVRQTTARVIGDSGGPFRHARLLDAGSERGVAVGMAVVDEHGMVGRVVAVGRRSARILLLTDLNSRIPVLVAPSGDPAILEGDNTAHPKLAFLPLDPAMAVGDRVMTSGHDGLLPPGLPVGEIEAIEEGRVTVRPYADWQRLDWVTVLQYAPVVPPEQEEPGAAAGPATAAAGQPAAALR